MAYNTGNPLGSSDPRDLRDNSENIDVMLNSTTETSHPDRIGTSRKTWHGMEVDHVAQLAAQESEFQDRIAGMAFTRVGTFAAGYTLTDARQVLLYETDGHEYGWTGAFPKVVPPASTPAGTGGVAPGAWVDRSDVTLRSDLNVVVKVFESVANMAADASLIVGQKCRTLGRNAVDDGGANEYEIVAAATGVHDDGSYIDLPGSGLQAKGLFPGGRVNLYQFGAVGNDATESYTAINNAMSFVKQSDGVRLDQNGGVFYYTSPLVFSDSQSIFTFTKSPKKFNFNCVLHYGGTDKALNFSGNGWNYNVYVHELKGPGVGAEGTPGGGNEIVGVYLGPNSGSTVVVDICHKFNKNILSDGAYFNNVRVNYSFECIYCCETRPHPTFGYLSNANRFSGLVWGGVYLAAGDPDYATKRLKNGKFGIYVVGSQADIFDVSGIEYLVREDDGIAVYLAPNTKGVEVTAHVEGSLADMIIDSGLNNKLNIDGNNSQNLSGKSFSSGEFSTVTKLSSQGTSSQITTFAPHQGQGVVDIPQSATITGTVVHQKTKTTTSTTYSYASRSPGTSTFIPAGTALAAVTVNDFPSNILKPGGDAAYQLETTSDSLGWWTVGPYAIPTSGVKMAFSCRIRDIANDTKCSIFILDQTGSFIASNNFALTDNSDYKDIAFTFDVPAGVVSLYYRISLRGFDVNNTGSTIAFYAPALGYDISNIMKSRSLSGINNRKVIEGNVIGSPTTALFAMSYNPGSQTVVSTAFPVNARAVLIFDNISGGTVVNSFTGATTGQKFTILNLSGSTLTISSSAIVNNGGSGHSILNNESAEYMEYNGGIYVLRK